MKIPLGCDGYGGNVASSRSMLFYLLRNKLLPCSHSERIVVLECVNLTCKNQLNVNEILPALLELVAISSNSSQNWKELVTCGFIEAILRGIFCLCTFHRSDESIRTFLHSLSLCLQDSSISFLTSSELYCSLNEETYHFSWSIATIDKFDNLTRNLLQNCSQFEVVKNVLRGIMSVLSQALNLVSETVVVREKCAQIFCELSEFVITFLPDLPLTLKLMAIIIQLKCTYMMPILCNEVREVLLFSLYFVVFYSYLSQRFILSRIGMM